MLACIIILIIFIPLALLPLILNGFLSLEELNEMGITDDRSL